MVAAACRFAADQPHAPVFDKMIEAADGVGAAAHTGNNGVGQTPFFCEHLFLDLLGDDGLEITDNRWERMGPHYRAKAVVRVIDAGGPFAHGLGNSVL